MKKTREVLRKHTSFDVSTSSRLVFRIAVLFSALIALGILATGWLFYQQNSQLILRNLQNQLQLAANTIAISIDGDSYQNLRGRESIGSPEYQSIKKVLREFMVNQYLGFESNGIYTFRRISRDSLEFTVMLQEEYVGNHYAIRPEMLPTLEDGHPSYTGIYEDENGIWVSAYAPILTSDNHVAGMVEVDFHNNFYLMTIKQQIGTILLLCFLGIGVGIISAVVLSRVITGPVQKVAAAAIQFAEGDYQVQVPVETKDEIGMLARAFNYMVAEIQEKELIRKHNQELKAAYDKLDALNHRLEEANRLKSEFLSIAAHDLKSPLQVTIGFAEMILDTPNQHEHVYRNAEKILKASKRMLKIIKQLLDTTALESGKLSLKKRPVDLGKLARETVQQNLPLAEKKGQRLHLETEEHCKAYVDPKRMAEVMDNLINNAIKYSPKGKNITILLRKYASTQSGNGRIHFVVQDEGPGLSGEDLRQLFGKFQRLSAQPTGGESSTGLGLSIVKQLVELHQGRVWAESDGPGKGSRFIVEIG